MSNFSLLPKEFVSRVRKIVPPEKQAAAFSSFSKRKTTTFRANTLKISAGDLERVLRENGVRSQRYRSIPDAFVLIGDSTLRQLTSLSLYREGFFYVQSLSSMLPPLILDPRRGENVLDLTAAPGSKTTQMAALMNNSGRLVAGDSDQRRIYKLLANLKVQGVTNVEVKRSDSRFFWREHFEEFDRVLLDAPCTTEGSFLSAEPETFAHWSLKEVRKKSFLQRSLIFSAVNCLRPGGVLVYSTCTLAPEENEAVVDFALRKFKGRLAVETPALRLPNFSSALTRFGLETFNGGVGRAIRVFPDDKFEGFFICRLKKIA